MLLPPLTRACRPGFRALPPHPLHSAIATRVFTSSPLHRKDVHGSRPASVQPGQSAKQAPLAAKAPSPKDALLAEQTVSNKEQRKADCPTICGPRITWARVSAWP
jgi:ATP-binding cassette subfamily B (MDR/TAP) protein 7